MSGSNSATAAGPSTPLVGVKGTREERGGASKGESPEDVKRRAEAEGRVEVAAPTGATVLSTAARETIDGADDDDEEESWNDEEGVVEDLVFAITQNNVTLDECELPSVVYDDDVTFEVGEDFGKRPTEDVDGLTGRLRIQ